MNTVMPDGAALAQPDDLLALYDDAVTEIYRYVRRRCGSDALAEDLTSETFLAAAHAVGRGAVPELTIAWLISVARNKLVDHWRRAERELRKMALVEIEDDDDPWDAQIDAVVAHETLNRLAPPHRAALTLRYLDDLPVAEIAACLDRTVGATEVLLVRARRAFREAYETSPSSSQNITPTNTPTDMPNEGREPR